MEIIESIIAKPLSFDDLKLMLANKASSTMLLNYDLLAKVESMKQLFVDGIDSLIILLDIEGPNAPKVGHFIAILDHGDHYEHFDPYGISLDEELAITHDQPWLSRLLTGHNNPRLEENTIKFQAKREDVNTCGRWCVARVHSKFLELPRFQEFIKAGHNIPDVVVVLMTMFLPITEEVIK